MESSILVYIGLTVITLLLGLCVDNKDFVPVAVKGGREFGKPPGLERRQARNLTAEFAIFCLLSGVSACRIAVGNDYWVYVENFKLIAQKRHVSSEIGFNALVWWMQDLFGYNNYLPIFAVFSLVTVFFFVKALHDQGSNYVFSLFLLLTGGYYFHSLNSVRYYLALAIALFSMKYVLRGEYGKFILWAAAGAAFHKSILLVIPVYLMAKFLACVKLKKWHYVLGAFLIFSLIFGQDIYRKIIFYFYPYYENSVFDNGQISVVNIGKCVGTLALCAICGRDVKEDVTKRFYMLLNLAGLVAYSCGSFIPEVSRVGYYLIISQIFLLPMLLQDMKKGTLKNLCRVGVTCAFAGYFVFLLRDMYLIDVRLLPYLNWIFD